MLIRISDSRSADSSDYAQSPHIRYPHAQPKAASPRPASPASSAEDLPFDIELEESDRNTQSRAGAGTSPGSAANDDLSRADTGTHFAASGSRSFGGPDSVHGALRSRERSRPDLLADPAEYGTPPTTWSTYDGDIEQALQARDALHHENPRIAPELRFNDIEPRDLRASLDPAAVRTDASAHVLSAAQLDRFWQHQQRLETMSNAARTAMRLKNKFVSSDRKYVAKRYRTAAFDLLLDVRQELHLTDKGAAWIAQHVDVLDHVKQFGRLPPVPELRKIIGTLPPL